MLLCTSSVRSWPYSTPKIKTEELDCGMEPNTSGVVLVVATNFSPFSPSSFSPSCSNLARTYEKPSRVSGTRYLAYPRLLGRTNCSLRSGLSWSYPAPMGADVNNDQIIPATIYEQIEQRAYEIYEERNREDGHALDDWLKAESE